jgi:hypothetical protein
LGAELVRMATRITRMGQIGADFFWIVGFIGCEGGLRPVWGGCAGGVCGGAELSRMATRITRMGRIGADFFGLLVLLDGEREC